MQKNTHYKTSRYAVMSWQFEGERKGDIIYKYRKAQSDWLRNKGFLEELDV